jgi:hypothetical protein
VTQNFAFLSLKNPIKSQFSIRAKSFLEGGKNLETLCSICPAFNGMQHERSDIMSSSIASLRVNFFKNITGTFTTRGVPSSNPG